MNPGILPTRLWRTVMARLRQAATPRFAEPIVVLESDDWGLDRTPCRALIDGLAVPSEWADEARESEEDLERLYRTLERVRDSHGRPACFTANVVLANPDFPSMEDNGFKQYVEKPLSSETELVEQYRNGEQRQVFRVQFHARHHFWPERWLADLRRGDPVALRLFEHRCHGGAALVRGRGWSYHSEYVNAETGESRALDVIRTSLEWSQAQMTSMFDHLSESTIAPHYIFDDRSESAWNTVGIRYVQGCNYHIGIGKDVKRYARQHRLGEVRPSGLVCLSRNVKFEPRPSRRATWAVEATAAGLRLMNRGVPVEIDTHRINYTGANGAFGCEQLGQLLQAVTQEGCVFLTADELGEALAGGGHFTDRMTGRIRRVNPLRGGLFRSVCGRVYTALSTARLLS